MAATTNIKITNEFADNTTQAITIGPVETTKLNPTLKEDIIAFNSSMQSAGYGSYLQSKAGADWVGISAVEIITTDRQYIF